VPFPAEAGCKPPSETRGSSTRSRLPQPPGSAPQSPCAFRYTLGSSRRSHYPCCTRSSHVSTSTPVLLTQPRKLPLQLVRALALELLHSLLSNGSQITQTSCVGWADEGGPTLNWLPNNFCWASCLGPTYLFRLFLNCPLPRPGVGLIPARGHGPSPPPLRGSPPPGLSTSASPVCAAAAPPRSVAPPCGTSYTAPSAHAAEIPSAYLPDTRSSPYATWGG